jgi:hypothetical protein
MEEALQLQAEAVEMEQYRCIIDSSTSYTIHCPASYNC